MVDHIYILLIGWKAKKQQQISSIKNDNKCFQYAATLGLNHKEIGKELERITKIKPVVDKYNCEGIK